MESLFSDPSTIWLIVGALAIIFEFFAAPGLGVVFAGIGALTTGALLQLSLIESPAEQWITFAAATGCWALLLWKQLKRAVKRSANNSGQSHIIGTEAIVAKGGVTKTSGAAKWSGTHMSAKLVHSSKISELKEGQIAEVVALEGSTLMLTVKNKE